MRLQTIDRYKYQWGPVQVTKGKGKVTKQVAPDSLIRLVIGESVPPQFLELLGKHLMSYPTTEMPASEMYSPAGSVQRTLWD